MDYDVFHHPKFPIDGMEISVLRAERLSLCLTGYTKFMSFSSIGGRQCRPWPASGSAVLRKMTMRLRRVGGENEEQNLHLTGH